MGVASPAPKKCLEVPLIPVLWCIVPPSASTYRAPTVYRCWLCQGPAPRRTGRKRGLMSRCGSPGARPPGHQATAHPQSQHVATGRAHPQPRLCSCGGQGRLSQAEGCQAPQPPARVRLPGGDLCLSCLRWPGASRGSSTRSEPGEPWWCRWPSEARSGGAGCGPGDRHRH